MAKYIVYLLGADDAGRVSLLGRGALRAIIRNFMTGKAGYRKSRVTTSASMLSAHVNLLLPRDFLDEGQMHLGRAALQEIEKVATELIMETLAARNVAARAMGYETKRLIYDFIEEMDAVDTPGVNYDQMKKALQRFEAAQRHSRSRIPVTRLFKGTEKLTGRSVPGVQA